jgi:hypothetical protein
MEPAITISVPAEMTLAEEQKVQLSTLVEVKLEESKTLTMISTDEQFVTAGEQLKVIAQLPEIKIKPLDRSRRAGPCLLARLRSAGARS